MVAQEELNSLQSVASVREVLEEGFNEFSVEAGPFHEQIRMVLDLNDPSQAIHRYAEHSDGAWGPAQDEGGEKHIYWIDGEWKDVLRPVNLPVEFSTTSALA